MSPTDDQGVDDNGDPYPHDTYPPGTIEAFIQVRRALIQRLKAVKPDIDQPQGERFLNDLAARLVAVVRLELWRATHQGVNRDGDAD